MEVKYTILYLEELVRNDIPLLSPDIKILIKQAIEKKLMLDPVRFGKPLRYSLKGHRRLRVGDYRIIYRIESDKVIVIAIKHRRLIYEDAG